MASGSSNANTPPQWRHLYGSNSGDDLPASKTPIVETNIHVSPSPPVEISKSPYFKQGFTEIGGGVMKLPKEAAKLAGQGGAEVFKGGKVVAKRGFSAFKAWQSFIARGDVVALAVALVMGTAFTAIVNSMVKDLFTPFLGLATGKVNLEDQQWQIPKTNAFVMWGRFVQTIISFLIISLCMFFMVQLIELFKHKKANDPSERECPYCLSKIKKAAVRCAFCTSHVEKELEEEEAIEDNDHEI